MIPEFDYRGHLPPGIHPATIEEIEGRFGRQSEVRRAQIESIGWLVDLARRAGVLRIIIDGSFVTDTPEPDDVDCVLLIGPGFPSDRLAEADLDAGLPFIGAEVVGRNAFDDLVRFFATDRAGVPKGMIEVTHGPAQPG